MSTTHPNRQEFIRLAIAVINDRGLEFVLERVAPHVGICPECEEHEFTHREGCKTAARIEECWDYLQGPGLQEPEGERPWELGAIVTFTSGEPPNVHEVIEELKSQGLPL